jgi:ABC-type lipoprotein release transport system permease subunit
VRSVDLVGLALAALYRQKVRTLLTTLAVVFGSLVLVASLSIRQGVHETIAREFSRYGELREININRHLHTPGREVPAEKLLVRGEMSEAKRQRLRKAITRHEGNRAVEGTPNRPRVSGIPLTRERAAALAEIDHVRAVRPFVQLDCSIYLNDKSEHAVVVGTFPEHAGLRQRIVAGDSLNAADTNGVVIGEHLLYTLGISDDAAVERMLGRRLRLEQRTPEGNGELAEEFTIRGVCRDPDSNEEWRLGPYGDVFLLSPTAVDLFERSPEYHELGFRNLCVEVDDIAHVKEVFMGISAQGLQPYAMLERVEEEQFKYLLIFGAMTVVAFVSLAVAALGITNTMLMGVLERVREIGIMKAVGARDGDIQMIFLIEGGLVGLVGGGLGLLLGWVISFPADAWVRSIVEQMDSSARLETSIFVFPAWLVVGVPLFACAMTTLAAFYPARRAARVNPIAALRHD